MMKPLSQKTRSWTFRIFAALSFTRAFILLLNLTNLAPWHWLTALDLMIAPQTVVFADPLFYEPIWICLENKVGPPKCFTRHDYIAQTKGEYILVGAPFNHAVLLYQTFRDLPIGKYSEQRLIRYLCTEGVLGITITPQYNLAHANDEAQNHIACPI